MVDKISVQIQLEGAAEIERQLAGVSQAGQQCFADIQKAAEQAGGFAKLDPTVAAAKFKQFGVTATGEINKINAALKSSANLEATVLGVSNLEKGFKKAGAEASRATAAFGLTRREIGALSRAARAVDLGPLGSQLALIGRVGGAFGPVGIAITAIGVAIAGAAGALVKFAVDASQSEKALTQLQKVSGVSFENLSSLQQVFAAGGTPLAKFADDFGKLSESIAEAGQQAAIRNADKDVVQWANDVDMVRQKFDELNVGAFSRLTTLDTKVQALRESLAKVPAADQWFKLADIFKNLGSDLERAQIGKKLGLSPEEIATLSQGSEALRQLQAEAQRLGLTLTSSNQQALQQMAQAWNQFSALIPAIFQKIGAAAAPALTNIIAAFQLAAQQIVSDFQNMPLDQAIANIGNRLAGAFSQLGAVLSPILSQIGTALGEALVAGIIAAVRGRLAGAGSGDTMGPLQPGTAGFESRAGGGLLGGRGTGTSDSNLAWVSRGEHIMPARAVRQPGVLAFLEALRRSGGNLAHVLDGMGRFALGGMVPRAMPAFASGGLSGGNNVTIQFPGLQPIGGLRASSEVVDQLRKAAALAQVRSGGRKPSRYA